MGKWINSICPLVMIFILVSFGFKAHPPKVSVPENLKVNKPTEVLFPKNKTDFMLLPVSPPFIGSAYVGFKEALAFKESQGNYFITNTLGYLGKYQFGIGTLELIGVYNATHFLNDPVLQESAFHTNIARNKWILRKDIQRFVGKKIQGVEVTESGILAAAHLAGPGNVKKFLRSNGTLDTSDGFGSTIGHYMKKFSGYDISHVAPVQNPKISKI